MEILIEEDGCANYLIEFEQGDFEFSVTFNVFKVNAWGPDNEVIEKEHYLKGQVKWDGCSHIYFGKQDGYLHLCGKYYFDSHKKVMDAIWVICSKKIKKWNNDMACH